MVSSMKRALAHLVVGALAVSGCTASNAEPELSCATRLEPSAPLFAWSSSATGVGWSESVVTLDSRPAEFAALLPWPVDGNPQFEAFREVSRLDFTFESIRYVIPDSPIALPGLVMLLDGGSGSALWFETTEGRLLTESFVDDGYAVLAIDLASSDFSNFVRGPQSNDNTWHNHHLYEPHVAELGAAVEHVMERIAPADSEVPRPRLFSVGFSKGGTFGSFAHRDLPLTAQVLFNTTGHSDALDSTRDDFVLPPSTMWILGSNDNAEIVEDDVVIGNRNDLAEDYWTALDSVYGGKLLLFERWRNSPTRPSELAFARIKTADGPTVSPEESEALYAEMSSWQPSNDPTWTPLIIGPEEGGCPLILREAPSREVIDEGGFDWGDVTERAVQAEVSYQINEMGGYHQISSEFAFFITVFFDDATTNAETMGLP